MERLEGKTEELVFLVDLVQQAGLAIMEHYSETEHQVDTKTDGTPVTLADMAAHDIIVEELMNASPTIPVISEESSVKNRPEDDEQFWLVDPLDGTREFINRNGEFTVNIALINHGRPILGVVHAPALGVTYFGQDGVGAWKIKTDAPAVGEGSEDLARYGFSEVAIEVASSVPEEVRVVASRSHADSRTTEFLAGIPRHTVVSAGSSLKFCLVAEGKADLYPRLGTTMEWDTAAGQCVLECAGGKVVDLSGKPLVYRKPEWRNPHFLAYGRRLPDISF